MNKFILQFTFFNLIVEHFNFFDDLDLQDVFQGTLKAHPPKTHKSGYSQESQKFKDRHAFLGVGGYKAEFHFGR